MNTEKKIFLDLNGLTVYDGLIKKKTAADIAVLGEYGEVSYYTAAEGKAVERTTYFKMFGSGTDGDPYSYEALPYNDPDTGISWAAPAIGDDVTGYYVCTKGVELTAGLVKEYVDSRLKSAIEGVKAEYPLYYKRALDPETGEYDYVYDYFLTEDGTAQEGKSYYERTGSGSTADPYKYALKQVETGSSVEGMYERGSKQTTTTPTEEEKKNPVLNESGVQETETKSDVDSTTSDTIMNVMSETGTISDSEIMDLFG